MKDLYFRVRAKAWASCGVEDVLSCVTYDNGEYIIRIYDDVANLFTRCHSLSKNATKKLIKAAKICIENNLVLPQDPHGFETPEWYIAGYSQR